jgi:hypothetical protein
MVDRYQRFGGTSCLLLQDSINAGGSPETLVTIYQTTRRRIAEVSMPDVN